jgi:hypothetical protein
MLIYLYTEAIHTDLYQYVYIFRPQLLTKIKCWYFEPIHQHHFSLIVTSCKLVEGCSYVDVKGHDISHSPEFCLLPHIQNTFMTIQYYFTHAYILYDA